MKINFTKHALLKIELLKQHGFNLEIPVIEEIILYPDKIDIGYKNRFIAQKVYDVDHVLRVVYEVKENEIYVITIYPGRRERYEKN